jgi:predicted phosphodiesterase
VSGALVVASLVLVLVLVASACDRCNESSSGPRAGSDAAALTSSALATDGAPPIARRTRKGGTDVTFLVVSDTHFGYGGMEAAHEVLIPALNGIAGKPYPPKGSGVVAPPRGVLVTGDLTEWGKVEEWEPFVATYGLTGKEGKLRLPVFEVIGNHDRVHGPWVEQQVAARHGGSRFHSWDWDDLHLVALGEAPDDEGLKFLAADLDKLARDVPLVLYFHLALAGPWSTGNWFDDTFKDRLATLLDGRNVSAIFHGHHHATDHYMWHGIDVFKPGAVKNDAHTFAVVHVTDDRFTLASRDWDHDAWAGVFEKTLPSLRR